MRTRVALRTAGFASLTAASLPAFAARLAVTPEHNRRAVRDAWVRDWASRLLKLFDVRVDTIGAARPAHGALIVANHRSAIDVGLLLHLFGGRMVSRADLASWPVLGPAARMSGTLFVERQNKKSGADVLRQIEAALSTGDTVCLFPEGTTFADDTVRPFHGGAFMAAKRAGAPIVPLGIAYQSGSDLTFVNTSFGQHLLKVAAAPGARVTVAIGEAIPASSDLRQGREFAQHLRQDVQRLILQARAHVDRST